MQPIDDKIVRSIRATRSASTFSEKHFEKFGSAEAVRQALSRLVKQGKLRRIRRGLYDLPRQHPILGQTPPDPMEAIKGLMDGSSARWQVTGGYAANLLGLSEQIPGRIVILTDGTPRKVSLGKLELEFRRAAPRNLLGAGTTAGMVIQAIRHLREKGLEAAKLETLGKQLDRKTIKELCGLTDKTPAWMRPILRKLTGKGAE
jgi:hypothetical protein